ncbi:MAG TPA: Rieske 2Fe-2S domain-containing protein [Pirellulales bacterium]|jgi:nitrite reductase (NADH) small subunit|nr:Rieske 2Fe-2S domain-containing protein [Pirellulales bacterium]
MAEWMRVAELRDCPPGSSQERVAGDRIVAIFNVDGQIHAIDGVCAHQGGPLGEGELVGCTVTCPWHGWQFDVVTGQNRLNPRIVQEPFETRVEDGWILIRLP